MPNFIIAGYVWQILGRGPFCPRPCPPPHPWAAPKEPILNSVKMKNASQLSAIYFLQKFFVVIVVNLFFFFCFVFYLFIFRSTIYQGEKFVIFFLINIITTNIHWILRLYVESSFYGLSDLQNNLKNQPKLIKEEMQKAAVTGCSLKQMF